jgi:hypothetical protein
VYKSISQSLFEKQIGGFSNAKMLAEPARILIIFNVTDLA